MINSETISDMVDSVTNKYEEHLDMIGEFMKNNKFIILTLIVIFTAILNYYIAYMNENSIKLFDSMILKIIIFVTITFIFSENTTIAIFLALSILITYQIIANRKIILDLEREDYLPIQTEYQEMFLDDLNNKNDSKIYDEDKGCNENILLSYGTNPNRTNQKVDLEQLGFLENLQEQNRASFVNTKLIVELYNKFKKYPDVICAYNMIEKINEQISNENISLDEYDKLVDKLHRAQLQFMEIIINYNIKKMTPNVLAESEEIVGNLKKEVNHKNKHWVEKIGLLGDLLL
jgi:hypothetical protein